MRGMTTRRFTSEGDEMNAQLEQFYPEDDDRQAFAQIMEDRQHQAHLIAERIRLGLATSADADWIDGEYGNL